MNSGEVSKDQIKKSSTGEIKKKTTKVKSDAPKHVKETETVNEQPKKEKNGLNSKHIYALVLILLIGIIAIFIVDKIVNSNKQTDTHGSVHVDNRATDKEEEEDPLQSRYITFDGYQDSTLAKDGQIMLSNPKENDDFLIKYTISDVDTGEIIFETDLIPSGEHIAWTPGEKLEAGVYHISLLQTPYWQQDNGEYMPLTAGNNEVTLTII